MEFEKQCLNLFFSPTATKIGCNMCFALGLKQLRARSPCCAAHHHAVRSWSGKHLFLAKRYASATVQQPVVSMAGSDIHPYYVRLHEHSYSFPYCSDLNMPHGHCLNVRTSRHFFQDTESKTVSADIDIIAINFGGWGQISASVPTASRPT